MSLARRRGTSWSNEIEALVIADWIRKNRELLIPQGSLGEAVAVVTPFKAQIPVLRKALKQAGLEGDKIVVGTIHALQGAEKDIVIFSSVYSFDSASGLFFDRGVNMLNVAVSRAKKSFLVFGDMRLFRPEHTGSPSGLLARHLYRDPDNEIRDVEPTTRYHRPTEEQTDVLRINTLEDHQALLKKALKESKERLLIVSPFLSIYAIEADDLLLLLEQTLARGVRIAICYDPFLNQDHEGRLRERAQKAVMALEEKKITLWPITPAHNKTLAVDEEWIVDGSFNWLSAARRREDPFQRQEASIFYQGIDAGQFIEQAWEDARKIRVKK